jgi:hypothetical protein
MDNPTPMDAFLDNHEKQPKRRQPGMEKKLLGCRLSEESWVEVHKLALDERKSVQSLLIEGLKLVVEKRGIKLDIVE